MHLIFAVDGSDGITRALFQSMQAFIESDLKSYNLSEDKVVVDVLQYGDNVQVLMNGLRSKDDLREQLTLLKLKQLPRGVRRMDLVLDKASDLFASGKSTKKVLVLLTGGGSDMNSLDKLQTSVGKLRNDMVGSHFSIFSKSILYILIFLFVSLDS